MFNILHGYYTTFSEYYHETEVKKLRSRTGSRYRYNIISILREATKTFVKNKKTKLFSYPFKIEHNNDNILLHCCNKIKYFLFLYQNHHLE